MIPIINKIVVSKGAIFDYEEIVCMRPFPYNEMKESVEKLLISDEDNEEKKIVMTDIGSEKELLLFLKKGYDFGMMRLWILQGICEVCDYCDEMEQNGSIRKWLEVEIL